MLQCVGGTSLQGAEGMLRHGLPMGNDTVVVKIAQIEGMGNLIPLQPGTGCLVNHRIDRETWNTMCNQIVEGIEKLKEKEGKKVL